MKSAWAAISAGFIAAVALENPSQVTNAFQGLSRQERANLDQGRALIRQASSARFLSLAIPGAFADEIRNRVRSLNANYIRVTYGEKPPRL